MLLRHRPFQLGIRLPIIANSDSGTSETGHMAPKATTRAEAARVVAWENGRDGLDNDLSYTVTEHPRGRATRLRAGKLFLEVEAA